MAQGVVPFLGTYLTDLVMLHTAMGDSVHVSDPGAGGEGRVPEARGWESLARGPHEGEGQGWAQLGAVLMDSVCLPAG